MPQRLFYSGAARVLHASGEDQGRLARLGARSLAGADWHVASGLFNFFLALSARRR